MLKEGMTAVHYLLFLTTMSLRLVQESRLMIGNNRIEEILVDIINSLMRKMSHKAIVEI